MNMKQVTYWEAQELRWHEKYIALEGIVDGLETRVWEHASKIADLEGALREISKLNNKRDRFSSEIDGIILKALGDENV